MRDDLLERGSDVESMLAAAAAARDGAGRLLAIVGPAGIGKTRLLGELVGRSDELGLQVLRARAGEFEVAFPFGVARQLVEPELARAGASERAELLAGAAALAQEALEGTPPREGAAADPSFAALHGLFWLTANLAARGPLLIVVDDAHWCDPPSLRWLSYLSRRLEGMPVLLAMSWRPAEPGSDTTTLDDLASDPATVVVRPQPLSVEAAGRIVDERVGVEADPAFVLACHEVTGGNPYLLGEVASMAVADGLGATTADADRVRRLGPGSISRWVLRRLRRLGPAAVALAFAVAVLEGDADLRQLVALSGLEAAEIAAVADSLVRGAILRRERPLEFAHPILREAVYADIGPIERAQQHARAAEALAATEAPLATVAAHLMATEPAGDERVVDRLRAAARDAFARGAPETARRFLERAWLEPPAEAARGEVLFELGLAEMHSGSAQAIDHLTQSVDLARDPRERASRAGALAQTLVFLGRAEDAVAVIARAIDSLPDEERALGIELEAGLFVSGYVALTARRLVLERRPRFQTDPESAGGLPLAAAALECALAGDRAARASELAHRALGGGALLAATGADSPPFYMAANTLLYADDLAAARQVYADAVAQAAERGSMQGFGSAICWRAITAWRMGAVGDAEADARHFLETGGETVLIGIPIAVAVLIDVLVERGDPGAAAAVVRDHPAAFAPHSSLTLFAVESRARLAMARGDAAAALEDYAECGRREEAWGFSNPALTSWRAGAALAQRELGNAAEADRLATDALDQARRFGALRPLGIALRAAGSVRGDAALLRESVDVLAESDARLEHARSLLELGSAERRGGDGAGVRETLALALAEGRRCESLTVAARAYDELVMTGARPRKMLRGGVEALTASERRIAEMARSGMKNREIAQALFVTIKTVEIHLRHAYRKLDIASRGELGEALGTGRAEA